MGAMKEVYRKAQEICDACGQNFKRNCKTCKINVLTTDLRGKSLTVVLSGTNKKILKIYRECKECHKALSKKEIENGEMYCRKCQMNKSRLIGASV